MRFGRRLAGALAALVTLATLLAGPAAIAAGAQVTTQATARAVVIVDLGTLGGGMHTSVIDFDGSVSGIDALKLAGADPGTLDYGRPLGEAVCTLYGQGDPPFPGECPGSQGYWRYSRAINGADGWTPSNGGASSTVVHDGDVEGWRYGGGAPPFQSFCAVAGCAPPVTAAPGVSPTGGGVTATGNDPGSTGPSSSTSVPATTDSSSTPAPTTTAGARTTRRGPAHNATDGDQVALAAGIAGHQGGGGGGGGSPVGVVVALAVAGALVAAGLFVRRRRAAMG